MSLNSVLGTARSAIAAQQVVIDTVGHNIANAQTAGYTRQRAELAAATPQQFIYGAVGTGVTVADVTRARDQLLDGSVRQESGGESAATQRQSLLSSVEGILGEPSDTGLANAMDQFWSGWSDLAAQPANGAAKAVVVQRGTAAATMLNQFSSRLTDLRAQTTTSLDNELTSANSLAKQIADLNGRIVTTEAGGGHQANDLRDARDRAVDQLAALGSVQAKNNPDGSMQVTFGTYTLVDGTHARQLQRITDVDGKAALAFTNQPDHALTPAGGSTQAQLDFLNGGVQGVQDQLDVIANRLATAVNAVVGQRVSATGATTSFFVSNADSTFVAGANPFATPPGPGTVTARSIRVNPTLTADASTLPTSSDTQRPSNNDIALAIAGLRTSPTAAVGGVTVSFAVPDRSQSPTITGGISTPTMAATTGPMTFADFYNATVTDLGVDVKAAGDDATLHSTLADQARTRRQSAEGVNTDEELTNLMQAQQAYAAAAKIVTTVQDMMKTLVEMF